MKKLTLLLAVATLFSACDEQLDLKPKDNQILSEEALVTSQDFEDLLNSCYDVLANTFNGRSQKISFPMSGNAGQPNANDDLMECYNFNTLFFNGTIDDYFKQPYLTIRRCNSLLSELTPERINELGFGDNRGALLLAEARFIRSLCYFDLTRKFGHPYGYTSDNSHLGVILRTEPTADILPRASVGDLYAFMISELTEVASILPERSAEYANKYAAHTLLAKVYFYQNDFANAAAQADIVINSGMYTLDTDRYGQAISSEAIFTIVSTDADRRSGEMQGLFNTGGQPTLSLSRETFDMINETSTDTRQNYLVLINQGQENEIYGYNRFDATYFNMPVLHLTEMLLIRSESLAELNSDLPTAINDLNSIKNRAYGGDLDQLLPSTSGRLSIIRECRKERRLETIGEAEHLFDIKRIGVKGEPASVRGVDWDCPGMLLQFPADERTQVFEMNPSGGQCN